MISRGAPLDGLTEGLVVRRLDVRPEDVVYLKSVVGASEGIAVVFSERGGDVWVAATPSMEHELDRLVGDLGAELAGAEESPGGSPLPSTE